MKITIIRNEGRVGVDGVFLGVDLVELPAEIHAIQFDTVAGAGVIEYDRRSTVPQEVRDVEREDAEWAEARAAGMPEKDIDFPCRYKTIQAPRPNSRVVDFAPYQVFVDRWQAANAAALEAQAQATAAQRQLEAGRAARRRDADQARKQLATTIGGLPPAHQDAFRLLLEIIDKEKS